MSYFPGRKQLNRRIREAVLHGLKTLYRHFEEPSGAGADVPPADLEAVEQLASVVRQQMEQEAHYTRARLWEVGAQRDTDDPYANELLFDALKDNEEIPAYYEALFRRQAEPRVGAEAETHTDIVEVVILPPRHSTPDEDTPHENKEKDDGQGG